MVIRKKLSVAIGSVLFLVLNDILGIGVEAATLENLVYVVLAYLGGQGLADFSKHKTGG